MGEYGPSNQDPNPNQAIKFIESLDDTEDGNEMSLKRWPSIDTLHEAETLADRISRQFFRMDSVMGIALNKLRQSGKVNFKLVQDSLSGQDDPNGLVHPLIEGTETEREAAAKSIEAFLEQNDEIIEGLTLQDDGFAKAEELESDEKLPYGYSQRLRASSIKADIKYFEDSNQGDKAAAAKAQIDQLIAEGFSPLTNEEIAELIDVTAI